MTVTQKDWEEGSFFVDMLFTAMSQESALRIAYEAQDYSRRVGFDFSAVAQVMAKVKEEIVEVEDAFDRRAENFDHFSEELGDCFFALVNLARHCDLDPEALLKKNVEKYLLRCKYVEDALKRENKTWRDISKSDISVLWKKAKSEGL